MKKWEKWSQEYEVCKDDNRLDKIEERILKEGFTENDGVSNKLFKNLISAFIFTKIYPKYEKEEWYYDFIDVEPDNIAIKIKKEILSRNSKDMKKEVNKFVTNEINNWLKQY